jgi:aerobic C4-dicarboxylate transport protein
MRYFPKHLYVWVVVAILLGGALGYLAPHVAVVLKPLGDGFVSLIKMLVAPVIFMTVVLGIAGAADMKKAGRVGIKSLVYFEIVSTVVGFLESLSAVFFGMVGLIMRLAPIGAGAAMAFTIGKYGVASLGPLLKLLGTVYLACGVFIFGVLGIVARLTGFSIFNFLHYLREELLLVLGTSSSESALVPLMQKLERLGCSRSVVGLVVPSGYSFNLDGTNIYLTIAALFIAQALNVPLTPGQEATLLGVAMLTSKGASGVTGAGFVTLAATLAVVPSVPVAGLALILGIDRFMSEARALTNIIGNGVATIVVARWEGELDFERLSGELAAGRTRPGRLVRFE